MISIVMRNKLFFQLKLNIIVPKGFVHREGKNPYKPNLLIFPRNYGLCMQLLN